MHCDNNTVISPAALPIAFHVIIPARYESTRFPGKLLKAIQGMSVLERVYRQTLKAHPQTITIATDHLLIADHAKNFGADVQFTASHHTTGTDRIAEAAVMRGFAADAIIVNVQGDEPFIQPMLIQQVAESLASSNNPMATLCYPLTTHEQRDNPNVVKVVRDAQNHALYFSRAPIPLHRDCPTSLQHLFRHIGLYAYRAGFLSQFVQMPPCPLEQAEALEQLRALWAGYKITVEEACCLPHPDINTEADLVYANQWAANLSDLE
ncbi:MAG: 3-deoxy-manno-octulosonate cytidylyltransferase [Legionella sp.]|nr:3-deoxy-manno-octulosonate cytidylyltransferase [Legionella sp.]